MDGQTKAESRYLICLKVAHLHTVTTIPGGLLRGQLPETPFPFPAAFRELKVLAGHI